MIAGDAYGLSSPVKTFWPTLYVDARLQRGARLAAPPHAERGVYVAAGEIDVGGTRLVTGQLGVLEPGSTPDIEALGDGRVMLLGGAAFESPRHIWWNFVGSSPDLIEEAKQRWRDGRFAPVPGESEFIPLPTI